MLKLKKLRFSNIRRFTSEQEIDFSNKNHLIQIDGENRNTGGSSGAGKSTIAEAFSYLLGINEQSATELQSRLTKEGIWVEGEFEGDIKITRGKKLGLSIKVGDLIIEGSSKIAEEKLDEIIGVPRHLFKRMCYKRQDQGGFFLNLTAKESYEFLMDTMGLNDYQTKMEKIAIDNDLQSSIIKQNAQRIESLKQVLDQNENLRQSTSKPDPVDASQITQLEFELQAINQKIELDERDYNKSLESIGSKPVVVAVQTNDTSVASIRSAIESLKIKITYNQQQKQELIDKASSAILIVNEKISKAKQSGVDADKKKKEIEDIGKSILALSSHRCPTCEQDWIKGADKLDQLKQKKASLEDQAANLDLEYNQISNLLILLDKTKEILKTRQDMAINIKEENELTELHNKLAQEIASAQNLAISQKAEQDRAISDWLAKKHALETIRNQSFTVTNTIKHGLEIKLNQLKSAIENYRKQLTTYNDTIARIEAMRKENSDSLNTCLTIKSNAERQLLIGEEAIRLIKMYTLQKFQDSLDYIGNRATELLRNIPNMANAVVSFDNNRETKSGVIRNEVEATINLESDIKIPIKTLCGGERAAADFAVDLSVGEFIETHTGKGINLFIIDEGFNGLDSIGKIECMEILKALNTNKKIVMIDHSSEVKASVHDIIKVVRIGEESHIEV